MAIILKKIRQNNYQDLTIDSRKIIGVMGDYSQFVNLFNQKNVFIMGSNNILKNNVYNSINEFYNNDDLDEKLDEILKILDLKKDFLSKKVDNLSNCDKRLIQYIKMFLTEKNIIVVENPFLYLDYFYKRKMSLVFKNLISSKTIIIGSNNSDDIYSICNKLLLINSNSIIYGDITKIFNNDVLLGKYGIIKPMILEFIDLCRKKGKNIHYTNDVRDLIKEVYKNV